MLGSYRNLEKLLGSEKLPLPRDDNDRDGYERAYKALGRPDTPDGYKLKQVEGGDPAFAGEASKWFHEAGLSGRQASALAERYSAHVGQIEAVAKQQFLAASQRDADELRSEWGDRFDANLETGRRAARQFGLDNGDVAAMERSLGTLPRLAQRHPLDSHSTWPRRGLISEAINELRRSHSGQEPSDSEMIDAIYAKRAEWYPGDTGRHRDERQLAQEMLAREVK